MGESGEVTLQDAIDRLESSNVRTRADGLADLNHVLRHNQQSSRGGTLADASFHRIFEALFKLAVTDRAVYTSGKTPALRSGGANRLSSCASALRLAVDVSVPVLRLKSVRAVLDHIDQTIEISSGRLCEPLAFDYAKCMRSLLTYSPHVEHLPKDRWERASKFCLDIVKSVEKSESTEESVSDMDVGPPNGTSYRSNLSRTGGVSRPQKPRSLARQVAGEMIATLRLLTAAPNAPLLSMASDILWTLIEYMKSSYTSNRSHQESFAAALATINNILGWTQTENTSLTKQATIHLVRLIRTHWAIMMASVKDEMILTLHNLQAYLRYLMGQDSSLTLKPELSSLFKVMEADYSKRQDRDRLQLDDIRLDLRTIAHTDLKTIRCGGLSLKPTRQNGEDIAKVGARGEHNWFVVSLMSFFARLSNSENSTKDSDEEDMNARPKKRQRTCGVVDDLLDSCVDGDPKSRITALQIVTFFVSQASLSVARLSKTLQSLSISCGEETGSIASWAFLAAASCAAQCHSSDRSLSAQWSSIWQIACRSITNATSCRAACHLLHLMLRLRLVSQTLLSELLQSCTTAMELSGPALICDSAVQLLSAMSEHVASINPSSASALADNTVSWLLRRWTPSAFEDRAYAATCRLYDVPEFVDLLAGHLRQQLSAKIVKGFSVWHTVARGFLRVQGQRRVVSFLLALEAEDATIHPGLVSQMSRLDHGAQVKPKLATETLILNHVASELEMMSGTWQQILQERLNTVSDEVFRTLCISVAGEVCLLHSLRFRDTRRHMQLKSQCRQILRSINDYIASLSCEQDKVDSMLTCFASAFWAPTSDELGSEFPDNSSECERVFCAAITEATTSRRVARDTNSVPDYDDAMDLDQSYASQESRRAPETAAHSDLIDDISAVCSISALRAAIPLYASIRTTLATEHDAGQAADSPPSAVVDIILNLSQQSILASRSILGRLTDLMPDFGVGDADRLLEHLTQTMLTAYPFERSEVAIGTVLETMINLRSLWTNPANTSLYDLGIDTYDWCASTALKGGVLSPNAQTKVANLLLQISHIDGDYGRAEDVPSVWVSLFQLLKSGAITAQFFLAERISTLFERYTLSRHDGLFNDLQESLPAELEKVEGMAIRLLFLAKLAASWHTLRRQCVYYIFETAGSAQTALPYASICVKDVANSLGFDSPQVLFRLFAPQLLHTWLEGHQLNSLPYSAFGYHSLVDLLEQNQVEIAAQVLMRGIDSGIQLMRETLNVTEKQLIENTAWKSEAYAIGWEISQRAAKMDVKVEERLRKCLGGKQQMEKLCIQHFPAIMGQFYLSLNQDDVEDAWLERNGDFSYAAKALAEIKSFGYSSRALPTPQQPSFRGRQFPEQVAKLCRRSGNSITSQWNHSSLTLAVRMLLDSTDESMGSLHACSVLRKLRLMVATAGDIAFSGYPLELLIRSIRPFLTDSECADDALGLLQYLLNHSKKHLARDLSFLCGAVTLMSLQTQKHMGSQHDSTTQETQHRETVDRMNKFNAWIVQYLQHLRQHVKEQLLQDYDALVQALTNLHLPGNSRKDSPESILILLLVRQLDSAEPLFQERDVHDALMILAENFESASSPSEDALADDDACVRYAPHLWRISKTSSVNVRFQLWAASAAGRAYAATGSRSLFSHKGPSVIDSVLMRYHGIMRSEALIVRKISDVLQSTVRAETGLAEYTLRAISDNYARQEESNSSIIFEHVLPLSVSNSLKSGTHGYVTPGVPQISTSAVTDKDLNIVLTLNHEKPLQEWATEIAIVLCRLQAAHPVLGALPVLLRSMPQVAIELVPSIVHIVLAADIDREPILQLRMSDCMTEHLSAQIDLPGAKQKYMLELLLYLRQQPYPGEATRVDRSKWLDCDYMLAAKTAAQCKMPTFALILAESIAAPAHLNKRASGRASMSQALVPVSVPGDLQTSIFEQVDEPDSFYGVEQSASLDTVLARLDYENDGFKSLMFRSAKVDNHMRQSNRLDPADALGMIRSLSSLNLNSLTFALTSGGLGLGTGAADDMLSSARELQQWDVAIPQSASTASSSLMKAYQDLHHVSRRSDAQISLERIILKHTSHFAGRTSLHAQSHTWCNTLGVFSELLELTSGSSAAEIHTIWQSMQTRQAWMDLARFEDFEILQQSRQIALRVLSQNKALIEDFHIHQKEVLVWQAQALLNSSALARKHGQLQNALAAATQLSDLSVEMQSLGIAVDVAAKHEVASVLWASDERTASISMLRDITQSSEAGTQAIPVGQPGLLAQLGQQLADARLEKPSDILEKYLKPAVVKLSKSATGDEAGRVFHTFASFCDQQLQHPSNMEDYARITTLRQRKLEDVRGLEDLMKTSRKGAEKKDYSGLLIQSKKWFALDDEEYKKQKQTRENFILQSLQNYLLALRASDEHDICVLRFFALWLENAESLPANKLVAEHLPGVPSWKFVVLMNQIMSRLKNDGSKFQETLKALTVRMCRDHPYHGVHHLYASTNSSAKNASKRDPEASLRCEAATLIRQHVEHANKDLFGRLFQADSRYKMLAEQQLEDQSRKKRSVRDIPAAHRVATSLPGLRLPPATISLPLRPDCDYSQTPHITKFGSEVQIMSGLSMPKVLTAYASDGRVYRQLFKSGNDDLRQDAIMEQVFEEVSKMLQKHKATRQRNLHIRTYKVVPTTNRSGIIEFVPNSVPINDILTPAHEKYYPGDWKSNKAREAVRSAQDLPIESRIKEFRKVCDHLNPVLRHFFLERFSDPDEWFERRTAYTRTTASVSMLGHVLGLGDRHCHNIMLDEKNGEVIHIDLGVAFEAGRILPVPELVPFRLTRDIIDGMGVTKTEGVFRRCCEFTMDALRSDKDSIMTLLNVLRYDPLYSWTLSPLRAKRMQAAQDTGQGGANDVDTPDSSKKDGQDAGEADRALSVVEKKLSKSLSTAATVNELIQQATDERHLATLFAGWAAWY